MRHVYTNNIVCTVCDSLHSLYKQILGVYSNQELLLSLLVDKDTQNISFLLSLSCLFLKQLIILFFLLLRYYQFSVIDIIASNEYIHQDIQLLFRENISIKNNNIIYVFDFKLRNFDLLRIIITFDFINFIGNKSIRETLRLILSI